MRFMGMAVVREVNKMTRSVRYSRETKMIGEPSISARDTKRRSKGERYLAAMRREGKWMLSSLGHSRGYTGQEQVQL